MPNSPPLTATVHVPSWLWGADPARFFAKAGLHARVVDAAKGTWQIRTEERHRKVPSSLVEVHHLAGPRLPRPRFDRLAAFAGPRLRGPISDRENEVLAQRTSRALATKELVDAFSLFTLQTILVEQVQLPQIAEHVYGELGEFCFEGDSSSRVFPNAGVHVVRRHEALGHRLKMAGVLVRVEHDSRLASGDLSGVQAAINAGELVFSSSEHLLSGAAFLDAYLGPLLGAVSPAILGLYAMREFGVVLYSLGRPIVGSKGDAAEMLQLLPLRGPAESIPTPSVSAEACSEALEWWGARLNQFFGILTDPAIFTSEAGTYVPVKHIQCISTAEQLFRLVTSLLASHRDVTARKVLFFSVLDTLERLTGRGIEKHCSLKFANETLQRLRAAIPRAAAGLMLPGAERAVRALRQVQDGFYLLRQSGTSEIEILDTGAIVARLSPEKGAAEYVKMMRNATHGFGSNKSGRIPFTNTLLAHHTGDLPQDLPLLGYLYLLEILIQPDILRNPLYRGGRP